MPQVRVACVQMNPRLGRLQENLDRILRALRETDAELVLFPECALSGYAFPDRASGRLAAEPIPGPATERVLEACRACRRWVIFGMLERDGDRLFNSAVFAGPDGLVGVYRKMHLPFLGVDRFATPGDRGFPVFEAPFGRVGILICYDGSFPEAPRLLKLSGAQLVCLPTNWPEAARVSCDYSPMVRAQENHVFVMTCNRVGEEGGFRFRGGSKICDYEGRVLAQAGRAEELVRADLDLHAADSNRVIIRPGEYELDRIAHRRPEWYRGLSGGIVQGRGQHGEGG